jgi:quinol monooxygenase YgiN
MLKVVAINYIKAEKLEAFIQLGKELVQKTRQLDKGCIHYELLQDVKNPQQLTMLEEWEDQESLDKHMQTKHFKETMTLTDYFEKPSDIHLYKPIK